MAEITSKTKIALIGLGAHAARIYLPLLKDLQVKEQAQLVLIIERKGCEEKVKSLLKAFVLHSVQVVFIDSREFENAERFEKIFLSAFEKNPFNRMIVSCDPLFRLPYYQMALRFRIPVLADKPIFAMEGMAHDQKVSSQYLQLVQEMERAFRVRQIPFVIQAQRRRHVGYQFIKNILNETIAKYHVPITSIHIQHADGMWVMPWEWNRDNHPYKYGFGKLFHSGYHFVDILVWLLESNSLVTQPTTELEIATKTVWPSDSLNVWTNHPILRNQEKPVQENKIEMGEYDVHALMDFKNEVGTMTVANLQLQQNSFSDRNPNEEVRDHYKGIGRVRHERVDIKLSNLMNIQVHSYQTGSKVNQDSSNHFEVLIFRNTSVMNEVGFEKLTWPDDPKLVLRGLNEQAREKLFRDFVSGIKTGSDLTEHLPTTKLLSALYETIALGQKSIGQKKFDWSQGYGLEANQIKSSIGKLEV